MARSTFGSLKDPLQLEKHAISRDCSYLTAVGLAVQLAFFSLNIFIMTSWLVKLMLLGAAAVSAAVTSPTSKPAPTVLQPTAPMGEHH